MQLLYWKDVPFMKQLTGNCLQSFSDVSIGTAGASLEPGHQL